MRSEATPAVVPPKLDGSYLSVEQQEFFATFGYLHMQGLFTPAEYERISAEFDATIDNYVPPPVALETEHEYAQRVPRQGVGRLHDGSARAMIGGPIEHRMPWLLDHPRILGLLRGVIGEDFCYCSGDGNYYSGDTGWHPDGSWGQLFAVKVAVYLDELDGDSGCVRLIPGSHRPDHPIRSSEEPLDTFLKRTGTTPQTLPWAIAVPNKPGDVVIFNHDTYHASFNGGERRRMFTMNCTRAPKTDADRLQFAKYISIHSPGPSNLVTGGGMFYPGILEGASAERSVHLREPARMHDELFPHLAIDAIDRTPQRTVDQVRGDIEREIQRVCTPDTFYRPWEPRAAL